MHRPALLVTVAAACAALPSRATLPCAAFHSRGSVGAPAAAREDVNDIVSAMGLTLATRDGTRKPKKRRTTGKDDKKRSGTSAHRGARAKEARPAAAGKDGERRPRLPRLDLAAQLEYARNGHAVARNWLDPDRLWRVRAQVLSFAENKELDAWRQKVQVAESSEGTPSTPCRTIAECRDRLQRLGIAAAPPFLQYFNSWRTLPAVRDLAYDLGPAAAALLDVPTVRLYQDSLFWKRRGHGPTPWHVDARMAPFDTQHMITFWIPLDRVRGPAAGGGGGTGLRFCSKSHADIALPYWNPPPGDTPPAPASEWRRLERRYPPRTVHYMPLEVGDVTAHSGWTLHSAGGNDGAADRLALAITYVDGRAEVRPDALSVGDDEDRWSYRDWIHEVPARAPFRHELVPIVWPGDKGQDSCGFAQRRGCQ